jgi:peroxiredoxin
MNIRTDSNTFNVSGNLKLFKMYKKAILILLVSIPFHLTYAQSKKAGKTYSIQASLGNWDSSTVSIVADGKTLYTDSVQNGGFNFSGHINDVKEAYFILKTKKSIATSPFFIEPGTIRIQDQTRKGNNWVEYNFSFTGTPHNDSASNLKRLLDSVFLPKQPFNEESYNVNLQNKRQYVRQYILDHKNSILTLGLFRSYILYEKISEEDKLSFFNSIDKRIRNTYGGKELENKVNALVNTSVGKTAPLFRLHDTLNRNVALRQFRGKYVLIDFWASWCVPCRKENPAIRKIYNEFKDSGLLIVSVSLDTDKEKWLKAIKEDQLTWVHVSDLKGWENAVAKQYYVEAIPTNFLLDPSGVIIAKNLSGDELKEKLSIALKNR